jgi:hypothetical protein
LVVPLVDARGVHRRPGRWLGPKDKPWDDEPWDDEADDEPFDLAAPPRHKAHVNSLFEV